jgi:putative intracellular protease/amidase
MKKIYTATTEVEAVMLKAVLEEAGIPVMVRSNVIPGYERPVGGAWDGELLVPDDRAAEAREMIAAYLAQVREESQP